jgi:hypothetical protein
MTYIYPKCLVCGRRHRTAAALADCMMRDVLGAKGMAQYRRAQAGDRELAVQLVDIGYRALAKRLHPDLGGSAEDMVRLNRARDELKAAAKGVTP